MTIAANVRAAGSALPIASRPAMRLLPWLVALASYIAGLGGIGFLAAAETRHVAEHAAAAAMTLAVPADVSAARLETVLALLRQTGGVAEVRTVPAAETEKLLEPWLGPTARFADLPVPKLIDIRTRPDGKVDLAGLRQHLASVVPQAQLDDHAGSVAAMRRAGRRIEIVLAAAIVAAAAAAAAGAALAGRAALVADGRLVELLHRLGADDRAILGPIARRALQHGLTGGALGAAAMLATLAALGGTARIVQLAGAIAQRGVADWRVWTVAAGIPIAAGLIAWGSGRAGALHRLRQLP